MLVHLREETMKPSSVIILLVASCIVSEGVNGQSDCHDGWVSYNNECYFFSRETKSWVDSYLFCNAFGGQLVIIEDVHENNFLRTHLKSTNTHSNNGVCYLTAGTDSQDETYEMWAGSFELMSYMDWAPGEPNDVGGQENCVCMLKALDFHWNDISCTDKNHFICEKKLPTPGTNTSATGLFG